MVIIIYKINNGGNIGEYMTADGMGNYTKSISAPAGAAITFYFTYRIGTSATERNSSANPHTYVVGSSCSAKLSALQEEKAGTDVVLYPNPARDHVFIETSGENAGDIILSIYNVQGVVVLKQVIGKAHGNLQERIDLTSLSPGIYLVHCQMENELKIWQILKQ